MFSTRQSLHQRHGGENKGKIFDKSILSVMMKLSADNDYLSSSSLFGPFVEAFEFIHFAEEVDCEAFITFVFKRMT